MDISESMKTFAKNYNALHPVTFDDSSPHLNNIYQIRKVDRDGNVTGEYFGKNLITDWGMTNVIGSFEKTGSTYRLAISAGTDVTRGNSSLVNVTRSINDSIWRGSTDHDKLVTQFTPITYDPNTGLTTQYIAFADRNIEYIIDYNNGNIGGQPVTFRDIGIAVTRSGDSNLITHSLIYDVNGQQTTIVKQPDERLLIKAYFGVSINLANVIGALETNNIPAVISPAGFIALIFKQMQYCGTVFYTSRNIYGMRPIEINGSKLHRLYTTLATYDNENIQEKWARERLYNTATGELTTNSYILEPQYVIDRGFISRMIMSDCRYYENYGSSQKWTWCKGMVIQLSQASGFAMSTPESFEQTIMTNVTDNTFDEATGFQKSNNSSEPDRNGYRGRLPMDQLDVTSMKVYDYSQHDWVTETYAQDATLDYSHSMYDHFAVWYRYSYNGAVYERYIFVNDRTAYPIIRFDTSLLVWATDTYWDPSTYTSVNTASVQASVSKKKYYITTDRTGINPVWDTSGDAGTMMTLRIGTNTPEFRIPNNGIVMASTSTEYNKLVIPNPTMNCLITPNYIVYLDSTDPSDTSEIVQYTITNYDNDTVLSRRNGAGTLAMFRLTENGDKLVMSMYTENANNAKNNFRCGCYRIWTISNDKTVAPTYTDIDVGFTTKTITTFTTHSFSDKGYVVCTHNDDDEIKVIDLYGTPGSEVTTLKGRWGYALNRTTYVAYQVVTGVSKTTIAIYDMDTADEIKRFTLDNGYSVNCIFGWSSFVYVRVYDNTYGMYRLFFYNISNDRNCELTYEDGVSDIFENAESNYFNSNLLLSGWDHGSKSSDEIMMVPVGRYASHPDQSIPFKLIRSNDPTHFRTIYPKQYNSGYSITYKSTGNIMTNADGSFIGLETFIYCAASYSPHVVGPTANYSMMLFDIGDFYDNNHIDDIYGANALVSNSATSAFGIIYKDWVVQKYDANDLVFRPVDRFRIHKIEATTTSLQSFNHTNAFIPDAVFTLTLAN